MPQADLFTWIDSLWNKKRLEGVPPVRMIHRFLASDKDFAPFCRALQLEVREPDLIVGTWRGLLPKGPGAPKGLQYVAAKKPPAAEELVTRMMRVLSERREVVEQMIETVAMKSEFAVSQLYSEFGVEEST